MTGFGVFRLRGKGHGYGGSESLGVIITGGAVPPALC